MVADAPEVVAATYGRLSYENEAGLRSDFSEEIFAQSIGGHGGRLAWSRAAFCPCRPVDPALEQPDPSCPLCSSTGYIYYGPQVPQQLPAEKLTSVQAKVLQRTRGYLIRGLITSLGKSATDFDRLGVWERGAASVTVLPENKLYFRDRLVALDAQTLYREVVKFPAPPIRVVPLRYLITGGVLLCQASDRAYVAGRDFTVREGELVWLTAAPDAGTRLSMAYNTFLTYVVSSMGHVARYQNKQNVLGPQVSPEGAIRQLPLMAQVVQEFVPHVTMGGIYDGG